MSPSEESVQNFRKRLRLMQDKRFIRKRELLGLLFDVYELFMVHAEEKNIQTLLDLPVAVPKSLFKDSGIEKYKEEDHKGKYL